MNFKKISLLASLSLGTMVFSQATPYDGRVGINTLTPSATLNVVSKGNTLDTKAFEVENKDNTKIITVSDVGNVGIGRSQTEDMVNLDVRGRDNDNAEIRLTRYHDTYAANLTIQKAAGTYANPTIPAVGRSLANFRAGGYTGMPTVSSEGFDGFASLIETTVAAAPASNFNMPTNMGIRLTTNDGNRKYVINMIGNTGNVGIGTKTPTEKLEVNGNAKITAMTDASGQETTFSKAVVAKADGTLGVVDRNAATNLPSSVDAILGTIVETQIMEDNETFYSMEASKKSGYFRYIGQSITLPKGKWVVYSGYVAIQDTENDFLLNDGTSVWIRAQLFEENTTPVSGLVSTSLTYLQVYAAASGVWLIENTSTTPKTYYVKASLEPYGTFTTEKPGRLQPFSQWGEDYIFAVRRN